jgi:hypothetical protein
VKLVSISKIFFEFLTFNYLLSIFLIDQKYLLDKGIKSFLSSLNIYFENNFFSLTFALLVIAVIQVSIYVFLDALSKGGKFLNYIIYLNKISSYLFGLFSALYLLKLFNLSRSGIILCIFIFFIFQLFNFYLDIRIAEKFTYSIILILFLFASFYANKEYSESSLVVSSEDSLTLNIQEKDFEYQNFEIINRSKYYEAYDELAFSEITRFENNLSIHYYSFCCHQFAWVNQGMKSVGYIDQYMDKIIYINSYGDMFYFVVPEDLEKNNISLIPIQNNLTTFIKNKNIFEFNMEGVKGLEIINDEIFISLTEEVADDCVNTPIYSAEFNFENIIFTEFFTYEECALRDQELFNAHQSGGKILDLNDGTFLLTIGDYRQYEAAQDPNSLFGKIVQIDIETGDYKVVSMGHRNPQGLESTGEKNIILQTEHGPRGGDEINIIDLNREENFGWPISSYGEHYNPDYYEIYGTIAPLHKSHEDYGFIEPILYFPYEQVGSHGISDIEKNYFSENSNSYFIGTLNHKVLYEIDLDLNNKKIDKINSYLIDERIRDIEYVQKGNFYILLLENTPSFGFLGQTK